MLKLCFGSLLFILFFCINTAHAQSYDLYSIKLKSGLILKCELVNIIPDSFVTIRQYGNVSRIKCSEIIWIEFSGFKGLPGQPLVKVRPKVAFRNLPDSAWTFGFRFGPGLSEGSPHGYSDDAVVGSQLRFCALKGLNKRWEGGFSLGFDAYLGEFEWLFAAAALEARLYLVKAKPRSSFIYGAAGYGLNFNEVNIGRSGGANLALGIGQSSRTRKQDIFSITGGLRLQSGKTRPVWPDKFNGYRLYTFAGTEVRLEWRF